MAIITRAGKGAPLTETEMDTNLTDLRDGIGARTPNAQNTTGIKVGVEGNAAYGWADIHGTPLFNSADPQSPMLTAYRGGVTQPQFAENNQLMINFHLPHDYAMGTDLFMHVHWSHISATLTGGAVTWAFEVLYAKGFDQAPFTAPVIASLVGAANTTPYQHMVTETAISVAGGSATQLDTDQIEVDGVLFCRLYLDSNDLTDSVSPPNPFVHFVDIHYQSTSVPTKNKAPDFWT